MTDIADPFTMANGRPSIYWDNPGSYSILQVSGNDIGGPTADTVYLMNWIANIFTNDQSAWIDVTLATGALAGCHVRDDGLGLNDYYCEWSNDAGGTYAIKELVAGVASTLASTTAVGTTGTRTLKLEAIGTALKMYVNGVQVLSTTDGTRTGGRPGVWSYYGAGGSPAILDNFGAGPIVDTPWIKAIAESAVSTAGTSHTVTLPTGILSTDDTLIFMDIGSTSATLNSLTDWTEVLDESAANGLKIIRFTGSGTPSNPTFTTSASTRSVSIACCVSYSDKAITPQIGTTATGTSATPDPPSVTPTGGVSKGYLVIPFFGQAGEEDDDDTWVNTPPSGYFPSIPYQKTCGTAGTNLGGKIGLAFAQLVTGSAINPGTFGVDVSAAYRAQTVIIHPGAPVTGFPVKLKVSGTFTAYPLKLKAGGTFVEYPTKLKASGVFTP